MRHKMKLKNPLLVVINIDKSVEFYKNVLGLHKIMDFGANVFAVTVKDTETNQEVTAELLLHIGLFF